MSFDSCYRIDCLCYWLLALASCHYFFFLGVCAKALPAADFDLLLVLPSWRTFDAAIAALGDVCFLGAFVCDNALPAAVLDFDAVDLLRSVVDALLATLLLVTFVFFAISNFLINQ